VADKPNEQGEVALMLLDLSWHAQRNHDPQQTSILFAWFISHQPTVIFSLNKRDTSNQPAVLLSQYKSAPAISHQPNEQAVKSIVFSILCKINMSDASNSSEPANIFKTRLLGDFQNISGQLRRQRRPPTLWPRQRSGLKRISAVEAKS
jgi:4-amino-4-deoxy-L-arabinose transferase-like glycosyltransferase